MRFCAAVNEGCSRMPAVGRERARGGWYARRMATPATVPAPPTLRERARRAGAGARHVPAGFWMLLTTPSLWLIAVLPALIVAAAAVAGAVVGVMIGPTVAGVFKLAEGSVLRFLLRSVLLGAGGMFGFAIGTVLTAPALEFLSHRVELRKRGSVPQQERGLRWELLQSLLGALYLLVVAPLAAVVGLVPFVGPPLGALWAAHALSLQQTDGPLARRGMDFRARRRWHRARLPETLGFGLAALVCSIVPCGLLLAAPALTVGGTLLVLALEDETFPATAASQR